jgi:hypothetical protein
VYRFLYSYIRIFIRIAARPAPRVISSLTRPFIFVYSDFYSYSRQARPTRHQQSHQARPTRHFLHMGISALDRQTLSRQPRVVDTLQRPQHDARWEDDDEKRGKKLAGYAGGGVRWQRGGGTLAAWWRYAGSVAAVRWQRVHWKRRRRGTLAAC